MPDEIPTTDPNISNPEPASTPSDPTSPVQPSGDGDQPTYEQLLENQRNFRQYEKQYKTQIAEMKKQLKSLESQQTERVQADTEAENKRLAEQAEWQKLAEKHEGRANELQTQLEQVQGQMIETQRRVLTHATAQALGAINAGDLNFIEATIDIDISAADVEEQVKVRVEAMKQTHPYLFTQPKPEPAQPAIPGFNPSGQGAQLSDAQRIARIQKLTGQGTWGIFGTQNRGD